MSTITWRSVLIEALTTHGEVWGDIVSSTLTDEQLDRTFDDGWGGAKGGPFMVWTANWVYFPACYDGSEWVASVSRHPDGHATNHIGGG